MSYKVRLQLFEGPLDLLLYLIKKNELDIYDIPIAEITEKYLDYLNWLRVLDLDIAGEFLVMAATLMHIKSKMLLPPENVEEDEEELADPRDELVRRLLEYKAFKEAAESLNAQRIRRQDVFSRTSAGADEGRADATGDYFEASLFELIAAFSQVLKEVPRETFHEIIKDEITVEEKVHYLLHLLVKEPEIAFSRLFVEAKHKPEIIATFLAILELIKLKEILIRQREIFGEILIVRNDQKVFGPLRSRPEGE
ncbi:MAG: segregation/condensation protein A [Candidatus Omnitrophica bacterium]|nr:segregation/condensation protein A [Candidatus Omnitrophota bacterium]